MSKKLTQKDYKRMWGEDGPYSQVRLCEETRILDDSISRVFLVVEAEINPFTFEYVQKHRTRFADDEAVMQLLNHAENRGKFGYVSLWTSLACEVMMISDKLQKNFGSNLGSDTIYDIICLWNH